MLPIASSGSLGKLLEKYTVSTLPVGFKYARIQSIAETLMLLLFIRKSNVEK